MLQTSSPLAVLLASAVSYQIAGVWFVGEAQTSWRYVFLAGLAPVLLAFAIRIFIRESEQWTAATRHSPAGSPRALFRSGMLKRTLSGVMTAVTAVLTWWACNAFLPLLGSTLAGEHARNIGMSPEAAEGLSAAWKAHASNAFNLGGLFGTFPVIVLAKVFGRRPMFVLYFLWSALALFVTFGLPLAPQLRLALLFAVGAGVYGVFAAFSFYLPEMFPVRLRATGAGFCFNIGRALAAGGPLVVGIVSALAGGSSAVIMKALFWVGIVPMAAAMLAPLYIIETRDTGLLD
jgi:MFS family permease